MSQLVVSMTGFSKEVNQNEGSYLKYIHNLGCSYAATLSEQTNILIVHDASTEKYKIARIYDPPKSCVKIQWLLESVKKNKVQDTKKYVINEIFYNVKMIVLDYHGEKMQKIKTLIESNGGLVFGVKSQNQCQQLINQKYFDLILTTKTQYQKLKPHLKEINQKKIPIVDLDWLEESIKSKMCKFPQDYALNLNYLNLKSELDNLPKMNKKLHEFLKKDFRSDQDGNILENTLIYISDTVDPKVAHTLRHLICTLGGMYLTRMSPALTHTITGPLSQEEYVDLKKYGSLTFIVRVEWLFDSIYISKKMDQVDYFVRSFRPKTGFSVSFGGLQDKNSINFINSISLNRLESRKSISAVTITKVQSNRSNKKVESLVFKDYNFYVDPVQRKQDKDFADMIKKIKLNSGNVYDNYSQRLGFTFVLLKDNPENFSTLTALKNKYSKGELQPISFRWVNECINKGAFIPFDKDSFIYKPFNFSTPIIGFHKFIFEVVGLSELERKRIKQLIGLLGSPKMTPNKSEMTHCLCGDNFLQSHRLKEILKSNSEIKLLKLDWIYQCASIGSIPLQIESYLIQKQQSLDASMMKKSEPLEQLSSEKIEQSIDS